MRVDDLLGRRLAMTIRRFTPHGAFVDAGDGRDILLIGKEIPIGAKVGDSVDVTVYLDSEARPIATIATAKLELGQVAFLSVTECTKHGAFVDWGLAKDILVPFREQTRDVFKGERHPIGLYIDESGRLAGTMRVSELLAKDPRDKIEWALDEWVDGEAWRNDPEIGLFVIIERMFVGLVPKSEPHDLGRGDSASFRITNILPDGKIELSLRGHAHEELASDAEAILAALAREDTPAVSDRSTPEVIREVFGLSKKAFKRAVGRLLRERAVVIDEAGIVRRVEPPTRG